MMGNVNWLLIVTVVILAGCGIMGMVHGLLKTVFELIIGVVTLVLVMMLSPHVVSFLQEETGLQENLSVKVEQVLWEQYEEQDFSPDTGTFDDYVSGLPFFPIFKNEILNSEMVQSSVDKGMGQIISAISGTVAEQMVVLIGYAMTYLVIFLALRILAALLNIIEKLPIIHGINKLGGLAVGLAEGLCVVWFLGILFTVFGMTGIGLSAAGCIKENTFLGIVYGHNLLQQIIFWIV